MSFTVYEHIFPNSKRYIGITSQSPEARWDFGWGYKKESQPLMFYAIQKYKWANIVHNILYTGLTLEDAQKKERELILQFHTCILDPECNGYNMSYGGEGNLKYKSEAEKQEASITRRKEYREKNKERINQIEREYYARHREEILAKQNQKRASLKKEHKPLSREEILLRKRISEQKRKANMTPEQKAELLQKKREYYYRKKAEKNQNNSDNLVISNGGSPEFFMNFNKNEVKGD